MGAAGRSLGFEPRGPTQAGCRSHWGCGPQEGGGLTCPERGTDKGLRPIDRGTPKATEGGRRVGDHGPQSPRRQQGDEVIEAPTPPVLKVPLTHVQWE